jgi:hypothetical protein
LPRWVGPFQVAALVGKAAVKLHLLKNMGMHPVFHVSLVKPYKHDGTSVAPPPVLTLDNAEELEVDCIVKEQGRGSKKEYLVKWLGLSGTHNSWVAADGMKNAPLVVAAWNAKQNAERAET